MPNDEYESWAEEYAETGENPFEKYDSAGPDVPLVECEQCGEQAKTLGDAEVACIMAGCEGMMVQVDEVKLYD